MAVIHNTRHYGVKRLRHLSIQSLLCNANLWQPVDASLCQSLMLERSAQIDYVYNAQPELLKQDDWALKFPCDLSGSHQVERLHSRLWSRVVRQRSAML